MISELGKQYEVQLSFRRPTQVCFEDGMRRTEKTRDTEVVTS